MPDLDHTLRTEAPRVLGALVRRFGRFDIAEDAVQEALLAAAQQWPLEGRPEDPGAWLIRVGYRRMVDHLRSEQARHRREVEVGVADIVTPTGRAAQTDDSLTLLLLCCHPDLTAASRVALTLRAVGGLSTTDVAHAYGVTDATMGTRISRAKAQLRETGARFRPPTPDELPGRMESVRQVLYLIFNEGYTASAGDRLGRIDLAVEAIRLSRLLVHVARGDSEAVGLLSLMLLTEARRRARTGPADELVPLDEQDRSLWDDAMLREGIALIDGVWPTGGRGPYQLQAAIAAIHGRAQDFDATDWQEIVGLYLLLEKHLPTGPVMLGRVVAAAHAFGPAVGLRLLDELDAEVGVAGDPLTKQRVHAVRAHLLTRHDDCAAAAEHFRAAAALTGNAVERDYLLRRAAEAQSG